MDVSRYVECTIQSYDSEVTVGMYGPVGEHHRYGYFISIEGAHVPLITSGALYEHTDIARNEGLKLVSDIKAKNFQDTVS